MGVSEKWQNFILGWSIPLIQVMKDLESLTVISVEYYCKVNPACFKCFKMINSWEHSIEMQSITSYITLIK